jgi:hypothetical protein
MRQKYWLFFKLNGWMLIICGLLLIIVSIFRQISNLSYIGVSSIYSGTVLFIIDYVIQIQFESRNYLKQLTIQSSSANNSTQNQTNQSTENNYKIKNKERESILKMEIGKGMDFGAWFVAVFILIVVIVLISVR